MIVIKTNMDKIPDSCAQCTYGERYGCVGDVKCLVLNEFFTNNEKPPYKERPDECPLISLDSDLVRRKDVLKTVERICKQYNMYFEKEPDGKRCGSFGVDMPRAIMEIPAADTQETEGGR